MKRMISSLCAALVLTGSVTLAAPAHAATGKSAVTRIADMVRYSLADVIAVSDEVWGPDAVGWSAGNFTDSGWDLTCYY
jgi:hypothetical protein